MTSFQNQIQLFTKCRYFDSILKHEKLSSGDVGALSLKREKRALFPSQALFMKSKKGGQYPWSPYNRKIR